MRLFYNLSLCLIICCFVLNPCKAQITYFNVPSADITDKGKIAAQQQINFGEEYRSETTFDYGFGKKFEIGVNLYHLEYQPDVRRFSRNDSTLDKPYGPLVLFNAQKGVDITETLEVTAGFQAGVNLAPGPRSKFAGYAYTNLAGTFQDEHYKWSAGVYTGNARYLSEGPKVGFQAGFDAGIIYEKLHILGEWISGSHEMGQLALGLETYLSKHVPLAVGWQRTNREGSQAVIVQLTYTPK